MTLRARLIALLIVLGATTPITAQDTAEPGRRLAHICRHNLRRAALWRSR